MPFATPFTRQTWPAEARTWYQDPTCWGPYQSACLIPESSSESTNMVPNIWKSYWITCSTMVSGAALWRGFVSALQISPAEKKNLPGQIQNPGDPGRSLSRCTPVPWNAHWHKGRWWSGWSQPSQKCDVGRWAQKRVSNMGMGQNPGT